MRQRGQKSPARDRSTRPEASIIGSGHKQDCLRSHTWVITSPNFKCAEQMVQSPRRTSPSKRAKTAVSITSSKNRVWNCVDSLWRPRDSDALLTQSKNCSFLAARSPYLYTVNECGLVSPTCSSGNFSLSVH